MKEIKYIEQFTNYLQIPIIGKEGRAMLDLGYQRSFPMKSKIYFFVNGSITMCYTHVMNFLINNGQEYNVNQDGLGYGFFLGGGAGLPLTDQFTLEPGVSIQYYPTNLTGYPDYKPNFSIYLRILLGFSHKVAIK